MSPNTLLELPTLTVRGTPQALGEGQGEHLRALIHAFMDVRFSAVEQYCRDRGLPGAEAVFAVAEIGLARQQAWDPAGHAEHVGIARGAGVDPVRLYAATQMTDLRDVLEKKYVQEKQLKDPWKEDLIYSYPASRNSDNQYDLCSKGPDKVEGSEDDICNN